MSLHESSVTIMGCRVWLEHNYADQEAGETLVNKAETALARLVKTSLKPTRAIDTRKTAYDWE